MILFLYGCASSNSHLNHDTHSTQVSQKNEVEAIIRAKINAQGQVIDVYLSKSSGISSLDNKLLNAMRQVRLNPAQLASFKRFPIYIQQPFLIDLNTKKTGGQQQNNEKSSFQ